MNLKAQIVSVNLDSLVIVDGIKKVDSLVYVVELGAEPSSVLMPTPLFGDTLSLPYMVKRVSMWYDVKIYKVKQFREMQKEVKVENENEDVKKLKKERDNINKKYEEEIKKKKSVNDAIKKFKG